jgi:hypothetical protein
MSNRLTYVLVVLAAVVLVSYVASLWLRTHMHAKLIRELRSGNFDEFDRRINSRLVAQVLSPYARELLMFQGMVAKGESGAMVDQFNRLMALKLDNSARASLLMEGFNGFVKVGDGKQAKKILDAMTPDLVPDGRKELCRRKLQAL